MASGMEIIQKFMLSLQRWIRLNVAKSGIIIHKAANIGVQGTARVMPPLTPGVRAVNEENIFYW
jgi:hypothetical protein